MGGTVECRLLVGIGTLGKEKSRLRQRVMYGCRSNQCLKIPGRIHDELMGWIVL